ncbi:MAG: gfo/Idh/MocA family oxidoreductase, partial [Candidatus Latescibacterota bacterium]|nr:gfo/Idh/MocA family oxidoreductase [Candidatus Latescibacterota bacterium]
MSEQKVRVGLVGVGGVCAAVHYPGYQQIEGVEIVGICEPSDGLRELRQKEWGIEAAYARIEDLLAEV